MHPSHHVRIRPDHPAVIMAGSGLIRTYGELEHRSNQYAHLFRDSGLKRGDVVAVMLTNRVDYFDIAWGAQRAGLYLVCISSRLAVDEVRYILEDCGAAILFIEQDVADVASKAAEGLPGLQAVMVGDDHLGEGSLENRLARYPGTPIADESCGTDMLYSSGTTGRPKGIKPPLPEGPLDQPNALTDMGQRLWQLSDASVFLSPAPLYHAAPLRWCMAVHKLGGTVIVMEKFDAETALALIDRFAVTHAQWVPTHFVRMLKLDVDVRAKFDLTSLVATWHAAAPCPVPVKTAMLDWWGPRIFEFYSGTEANGLTHISPDEWREHPGSVGRAVWGVFHICDDDGNVLVRGSEGQVWVENGSPFTYHNDPEKTAQAHNERGWSTLGDVGWMDEEGYLYLTDRKNFMIISGGVNIYPQEIENELLGHPAVFDAAVFGIPDEDLGEKVVAAIQPMDAASAGDELAAEIRAWLRGRLASVKIPKDIQFERELPRQATGKMNKRELQQRYAVTAVEHVQG